MADMTKSELMHYISTIVTREEISEEELYDIGIKHKELPLGERNWSELNEALSFPFATGETFRCWIKNQQFKKGQLPKSYSAVSATPIEDPETEEDIAFNLKLKNLRKEKEKLQTLRVLTNKIARTEGRLELFFETLFEAKDRLPFPREFKPIEPTEEGGMHYIAAFSDLHYGAQFRSLNNVYSIEEAENRVKAMLGHIIEFVEEEGLKEITVIDLGDDIQGILRLKDLQINQIAVAETVVRVSRLIASFLNELSAYCFVNFFYTCYSNHSQTRPLGSQRSEIEGEDMGKIIFEWVSDLLANNSRVKVFGDTEKDYNMFNIYNFPFYAVHGHQLKDPVSDIKKLTLLHNVPIAYLMAGHKHCLNIRSAGSGASHNIKFLGVPSLMGSDPYADSLMTGSKAGFSIFGIHQTYGQVIAKDYVLN